MYACKTKVKHPKPMAGNVTFPFAKYLPFFLYSGRSILTINHTEFWSGPLINRRAKRRKKKETDRTAEWFLPLLLRGKLGVT